MPSFSFGRPKFEVTADDIANAIDRNSRHCPIAEAIARTLPNVRNVSADLATIRWSDPKKGLRYIYLTGRTPGQFIVDFDSGKTLKPFSFALRPPVQIVPMRTDEWKGNGKKRIRKVGKGQIAIIGGKTLPTNGNVRQKRQFGKRELTP